MNDPYDYAKYWAFGLIAGLIFIVLFVWFPALL